MPFAAQAVDVDGAVRRGSPTDRCAAVEETLARNQISIKYFRNQVLPESRASDLPRNAVACISEPGFTHSLGSPRSVFDSSVLGDVLAARSRVDRRRHGCLSSRTSFQRPTSQGEMQYSQEEDAAQEPGLQIATQVRDAGRQVQNDQKRVDSARAARELAERRSRPRRRSLPPSIQISFFVFQAQRDLGAGREPTRFEP